MDLLSKSLEDLAILGPEGALQTVVLGLLMAFVLGQLIAWGYVATHSGLSYSRTYTQSLVLLSMIVALVMIVIGNNIVTAFGLLGALAIVRFRNVLKDTRDTVFVFLTLVVGMAVGSAKYVTAAVGTIAIVGVAVYMHYTAFGTLGRFDGHLSFLLGGDRADLDVSPILKRFCRQAKRISVRHPGQGDFREYVFEVRLFDRERSSDFVGALRRLPGVSDVALVLHEELSEA